MKPDWDYTLYLVTDRGHMAVARLEDCVEQAIAGGCTMVQLREKKVCAKDFYQIALRVRESTARYGIPLIINDRADIALAVRADGLHIGQDDLPYEAARRIVGEDMVIGVSAHNLREAQEAAAMGADYLGVGALFTTDTKANVVPTTIEELRRIRCALSIPIVAIGGIRPDNLPLLKDVGLDGIAVSSAIISAQNPAQAARELKSIFQGEKR